MGTVVVIDPDCRDGKHATCFGGPCECGCHRAPANPVRVAQIVAALAFICERHTPDTFSAAHQGLTCQACSQLAGIPIGWPCPDREAIADLLIHPSNRLLPDHAKQTP
jgi:hypothetical protein